jgi:hypothetical protein
MVKDEVDEVVGCSDDVLIGVNDVDCLGVGLMLIDHLLLEDSDLGF